MRRLLTFTYLFTCWNITAVAAENNTYRFSGEVLGATLGAAATASSYPINKKLTATDLMLKERMSRMARLSQHSQSLATNMEAGTVEVLLGENISGKLNDPAIQNSLAKQNTQVSLVWVESKEQLLVEAEKQKLELAAKIRETNALITKTEIEVGEAIANFQELDSPMHQLNLNDKSDQFDALQKQLEHNQNSLAEMDRKIQRLKSAEENVVRYASIHMKPGHASEVLEKVRELEQNGIKVATYKTYSAAEHTAVQRTTKAVGALGKIGAGVSLIFTGALAKDAYDAFTSKAGATSSTAVIGAAAK